MILCVALYVLMLVNSIWEAGNRNACDPLRGLVCVVVGEFNLGKRKSELANFTGPLIKL